MTVDEAARELALSRWQVYALIRDGRLPADTRAWGRRRIYDIPSVEAVRHRPKPGRPRSRDVEVGVTTRTKPFMLDITCQLCNREYKVTPMFITELIQCPHCNHQMTRPKR